jgi:hypothetical protein
MTKKEKFFKNQTSGIGTTTINYSGYGYGKHYAGMTNVYGYDSDGSTFDYIVTHHRSKQIIKMIEIGEWWSIDSDIRSNYSTNGYTTRVGIAKANLKRCTQLADSHRIIDDVGKSAHDARVILRNK